MNRQQLFERLEKSNQTLLCVGPMSRNCVDVTISIANEFKVPMMLIASRRQIECEELGGGYVENWSTQEFVKYVRQRDAGNHVILARDHGGPWQHPVEEKFDLNAAMSSAMKSFSHDIGSGMDVIHVDASIDPSGDPGLEALIERTFELYEHCWSQARALGKEIIFEIGTEEQVGYVKSVEDFKALLDRISQECQRRKVPKPLFVVGQTGTKVMEIRNVGTFSRHPEIVKPIASLVGSLRNHSMFLKVHNGDYLTDELLALHPELAIGGINIAPEYGVLESKTFLNLLESNRLTALADQFLDLSLKSGKWKKWMLEDTKATDRDRAIISGHYVFASPKFTEIKAEASAKLKMSMKEIDATLQSALRSVLVRQLKCLGNLGVTQTH